MKIVINYDLLDKIQEAKTGFSLQRTIKPILIKTGLGISIISMFACFFNNSSEHHLFRLTCYLLCSYSFIHFSCDLILSKFTKSISKDSLRKLSSLLKEININTNLDLILESYK